MVLLVSPLRCTVYFVDSRQVRERAKQRECNWSIILIVRIVVINQVMKKVSNIFAAVDNVQKLTA